MLSPTTYFSSSFYSAHVLKLFNKFVMHINESIKLITIKDEVNAIHT